MAAGALTICFAFLLGAQASGPTDPRLVQPDPANATIEGRVLLPSGRSADGNVRITLSNGQNTLTTFFTDKHGEFRFLNLPEGTYYLQATGDAKQFDSVTETVRLSRGQMAHVNLSLKPKSETTSSSPGSRVVSAAELSADVPVAARKEYQQAVRLIGRQKREEAIEHLLRALSLYPEYMIARNDLGAQYLKLKQLDEAEAQFRRVLAADPKHYNSQYNLGLVFLERGRAVDASAQLMQAISIDPTRAEARLWLGVARLALGDFASAERELTRALISGGAEGVAAHYHLAQIYIKRGDEREAVRALNAYLEESPRGEYSQEAKRLLKILEKTGSKER